MKTLKIKYDPMRTKGNNKGLKQYDPELTAKAIDCIKNQLEKINSKGFRIAFQYDGYVYTVITDIDTMLQRVKIGSNMNIAIFCPFSTPQAAILAEQLKPLCTAEELENLRVKKGYANNGIAIQDILARKKHRKFDKTLPWYEGGEFENREVKFFDFTGISSPQVRFSSIGQLQKIGYTL